MKAKSGLHIRDRLTLLIQRALQSLADELRIIIPKQETRQPAVFLEAIREEKFGDYACTIAMNKKFRASYAQARVELKNPHKFAKAICDQLQKDEQSKDLLDRIEIAGPGFINLTIQTSVLNETIIGFKEKSISLCRLPQDELQVIIFEFVSANPTGPLNVVSARAAALGDVCCNLLEAVGHTLTREYYVNDYGNQITLLGRSACLRYLEENGCVLKFSQQETDYPPTPGLPFPKEAYHGEYIKDILVKILTQKPTLVLPQKTITKVKKLAEQKDADLSFLEEDEIQQFCHRLGLEMVQYILNQQKQTLKKFRVHIDQFFSERLLHEQKALDKIKNSLENSTYEKDGALFFRSSEYGDDKDRVLVRSDKQPTYFLADIAYHADKAARGCTHMYNIWGPDHHGYISRLTGAIQAIGYKGVFRVLIAQQVNLLEDGKAIQMSKRSGHMLSLAELLDEVPVDVLRYFFVMRSFESPMDFDLELAKDTSDKNPYYYIAYAYARICSIFSKVEEKGQVELSYLKSQELRQFLNSKQWQWTEQRRRLVLQVARFSEEVQIAAEKLEPQRLVSYLHTLATYFSQFYGAKENRIIEQEGPIAACLLAIAQSVSLCLQKGLQLLGTDPPQRLVRELSTKKRTILA